MGLGHEGEGGHVDAGLRGAGESGGGGVGEAGGLRDGVSVARVDGEESVRGQVRGAGLVTRDGREVESKEVGLRKARRRPQFSKR